MNGTGEERDKDVLHNDDAKKQVKDIAVKGLAVVGFVALLAIGTWGTIQMIRTGPSVFLDLSVAVSNFTGRFFSAGTPSLHITLKSYNVAHDKTFEFMWSVENVPHEVSYAFVYECADGLSFLTPRTTDDSTRISCGEIYAFDTDKNALTLIPLSLDNRFLDSTVKLLLVEGDIIVAEDEVLLTVINEEVGLSNFGLGASTTTTLPSKSAGRTDGGIQIPYAPVYTTVPVPRSSDPNGYVDLSIEIIRVGALEGNSNRFSRNDATLDRDRRGGVMFVIRNLGTKTSEQWSFEAELPTRPSFTFRRNAEQALAPGDRIEYTLGFDRLVSRDTGEIVISIDPRNTIDESNENNNKAAITVQIEKK